MQFIEFNCRSSILCCKLVKLPYVCSVIKTDHMKTLIDIWTGLKEVSIRIVLGFFLGVSITGVLYFAAQLIILFELY